MIRGGAHAAPRLGAGEDDELLARHVDVRDAHFNKQDIFAYNATAKAAHAYNKLIAELFHL